MARKSEKRIRIGATPHAFTIEQAVEFFDKKTGKKKTMWVPKSWFTTIEGCAIELRNMKLRSLISQGEEILVAIEKANKEIIDYLNPKSNRKIIELCAAFKEEEEEER